LFGRSGDLSAAAREQVRAWTDGGTVADDIAVLYLGRLTAQVEAKDVSHSEIVQLITGGNMVEKDGQVVVAETTADEPREQS